MAAHAGFPECPPEARELKARVEVFVRDRVMPSEPLLDAGGAAAATALEGLRREARDRGLWALPLPAELGGQGMPLDLYAHVAEAEGASEHGPAALGSATLLDALMLHRHGTERVREQYVRPLVAGELKACYAMTEPDTPGTDPYLTATRAEPVGDRDGGRDDSGWRISGGKWFTSGAGDADLVTVLARTDGTAPERGGLSLLLVPTSAPGFRVVRELPVLGAAGPYEIRFDGVQVAADHLLGERGAGLAVAAERLQLGRTLRCLRWLGQARRAYELMRERALARSGSRGALGEFQLVQRHLFESLLMLRTTRPLVHEAVARLAAGRDAHIEVGLAKVAAARTLQQVADAAIQVHGAAGLGPDTPLPALFRTGRAARILDGPDELHIAAVARRVLKGE
ncbi:acyl-CoA dehydrogenase family protein [Streptomyces bambusae]|uniref:acyl-CoA dehydrogenase family protein n=1 Tax=Streptomyces bambusae TaxID=1550616 RepID=UPI001CFE57DF|nr:acyl-CoA dehydrogenase family protein [Streptomyces bambusae]MCB5164066.1 acyl-CoA dehydrogenase family protein [Streptomyces bambusae]